MAQLENIKDLWKSQSEPSINYSKDELFGMMHQKSSSVVKWILMLSIIEFVIPNLTFLLTDYKASVQFNEKYGLSSTMGIYFAIHFVVILGFIYLFYRNYKSICVGTSVKNLMKDIIKTRKTVKYYIYYNILMAAVIGFHMFYRIFNSETFLANLPENTNINVIWVISIVLFVLVLLIVWLLYRLIFGFFLKKLNRNYEELRNNN